MKQNKDSSFNQAMNKKAGRYTYFLVFVLVTCILAVTVVLAWFFIPKYSL